MKKRTYIQPKMNVTLLQIEAIMIPTSPGLDQNTQYNPGGAPARRTPVF